MKPIRLTNNLTVAEQCGNGKFSICSPRTKIGNLIEELIAGVSVSWGRQSDLRTRVEHFDLGVPEGCVSGLLAELIDNSFRYSRKGTTVSISSRQEFGRTVIQIENSAEVDDYMEVMKRINKRNEGSFNGGVTRAMEALKYLGGKLRVFYRNRSLRISLEFPG